MLDVAVPLYGSNEEYRMITGLLARMELPATYGRSEQFFSGGTMFWYRPQALQPLLECGLRFEDFPEEPIGVGGDPCPCPGTCPAAGLYTARLPSPLTDLLPKHPVSPGTFSGLRP